MAAASRPRRTLFSWEELRKFLQPTVREIAVPGSSRTATYDASPRIGVGLSRLGTSEAVAIGAYAFALQRLDARQAEGRAFKR